MWGFLLCIMLCSANEISCAIKLGIECLVDNPNRYAPILNKSDRIGLIANQTSCNQRGQRTIDLLKKQGFKVTVIFVTEHGFDGATAASCEVSDGIDAATGIPVVSLYGVRNGFDRIGLVPTSYADAIDCLLFDIQDVGMRHYTYLDTLLKIIQSAAALNKPLIVCDRPNFLGNRMEGPQGNPRIFKQETVGSLPLRHGMTIGEVARYFNEHVLNQKADLRVVSMRRYKRTMNADSLFLQLLSPNIRTVASARGYSFLGVLGEVRPFDVGIGTDKAFQCITLPEELSLTSDQWEECAALLAQHGIVSEPYRYFSERKKKWYSGVQISIANIHEFKAFETLLDVLDFFKNNQVPLTLSSYFDTAVGHARVRLWLEGKVTKQSVIEESRNETRGFLDMSRNAFLYSPLPQLSNLIPMHDRLCPMRVALHHNALVHMTS